MFISISAEHKLKKKIVHTKKRRRRIELKLRKKTAHDIKMGSRRQQIMFFLFACLVLNGKITSTAANPLINDKFNYHLQRSPRVIGSNDGALGYVNLLY